MDFKDGIVIGIIIGAVFMGFSFWIGAVIQNIIQIKK